MWCKTSASMTTWPRWTSNGSSVSIELNCGAGNVNEWSVLLSKPSTSLSEMEFSPGQNCRTYCWTWRLCWATVLWVMWKRMYSFLCWPLNMSQLGRSNWLPDPEAHHQENPDMRKHAKYLARCKDVIWRRSSAEYLRGLHERHNMKHNKRQLSLTSGDVIIIKGARRTAGSGS